MHDHVCHLLCKHVYVSQLKPSPNDLMHFLMYLICHYLDCLLYFFSASIDLMTYLLLDASDASRLHIIFLMQIATLRVALFQYQRAHGHVTLLTVGHSAENDL